MQIGDVNKVELFHAQNHSRFKYFPQDAAKNTKENLTLFR